MNHKLLAALLVTGLALSMGMAATASPMGDEFHTSMDQLSQQANSNIMQNTDVSTSGGHVDVDQDANSNMEQQHDTADTKKSAGMASAQSADSNIMQNTELESCGCPDFDVDQSANSNIQQGIFSDDWSATDQSANSNIEQNTDMQMTGSGHGSVDQSANSNIQQSG